METGEKSTKNGKEPQDPRRRMFLSRLVEISHDWDAKWLSPKGKWCEITEAGLLVRDFRDEKVLGAIPWGEIPVGGLQEILKDNERDIKKLEMAPWTPEMKAEARKQLNILIEEKSLEKKISLEEIRKEVMPEKTESGVVTPSENASRAFKGFGDREVDRVPSDSTVSELF